MKKTAFLLTALLLLLASCCALAKSADDLAALGYLVTPGSSEEATLNALAGRDDVSGLGEIYASYLDFFFQSPLLGEEMNASFVFRDGTLRTQFYYRDYSDPDQARSAYDTLRAALDDAVGPPDACMADGTSQATTSDGQRFYEPPFEDTVEDDIGSYTTILLDYSSDLTELPGGPVRILTLLQHCEDYDTELGEASCYDTISIQFVQSTQEALQNAAVYKWGSETPEAAPASAAEEAAGPAETEEAQPPQELTGAQRALQDGIAIFKLDMLQASLVLGGERYLDYMPGFDPANEGTYHTMDESGAYTFEYREAEDGLHLTRVVFWTRAEDPVSAANAAISLASALELIAQPDPAQGLDAFHRDALSIMEAMRDSEKMTFGDASLAFSALDTGGDTYVFAVFDGLDFALEG